MTTTRRLTTGAARKLPTIGVDQPQHINKQHMGKQSSPVFPADYVYVTKLWPLTVSKSLFSECIAYEKLKLKVIPDTELIKQGSQLTESSIKLQV